MSSGKSVPMLVFETIYFSARIVMVTSRDSREKNLSGQLDLAVAISGRTTGAKLSSLLETGLAVEHNDVDITHISYDRSSVFFMDVRQMNLYVEESVQILFYTKTEDGVMKT